MQANVNEIGVGVSVSELVELLNDQRRGGFMYIHGYTSVDTGEVANHWVKGACLYPNMVARSVKAIEDGSLSARLMEHGLSVHRGVWVDEHGIMHNRKASGRVYQNIHKVYSMGNEADSVAVLTAISELHHQLLSPKKVDQGFDSIAKGTYTKDDEADGIIYFRDCMTIHKHVVQQGTFETTASDELPAIKKALRRLLPVGKYRAYKLAGNFEYVTIDGQAILQGANLDKWDMALAFPEDVKEAVMAPTAGAVADHIMGQD
jgi:hypothetical protein